MIPLKLHRLNLEVDSIRGCLSAVYLRDIRHGDRPHKFLKVFMLEISLVNDVRSLGPSNTVSVYPIWFNLDRVDKIEI